MRARQYRIETVTFVDVETTGRWTNAQIMEVVRIHPCVDSGLFHYDGTRRGSIQITHASLVEVSSTEVEK